MWVNRGNLVRGASVFLYENIGGRPCMEGFLTT